MENHEQVLTVISKYAKETSNLNQEIRAFYRCCYQKQGSRITKLGVKIGQISKVLQKKEDLERLTSSMKPHLRAHVNSTYRLLLNDTTHNRRIGTTNTTVIGTNRSDDIDLNDLNEPQEIRRNRVDDLEPIVKEGEVVNKPMMEIVKTRCDFIGGLDDYPIVEIWILSWPKRIGDVIVGEPFCKASCVEAKRFDEIITIRDGDDSVTYQMAWSNPRFKHLSNEKCNKIPPLLKVSKQDKMNGISDPYQKLKGFYKGVLNHRPKFIRDAKIEEWLTRGDISVPSWEVDVPILLCGKYSLNDPEKQALSAPWLIILQKWHNGTTSRNIESSSSKDGLAALVNKSDILGRDMKKLKESVHAIQVGCQICEGPHLDKDCPLNEEVKQVKEVRYGEFGRTTPFNESMEESFMIRTTGYYTTRTDNRPLYGERRQSLKELLVKHQEESARRSTEMEIEQLTEELHSRKEKSEHAKVVIVEHEGPSSPKRIKNLHGISFHSDS
ncbi:hypothetical protein Tco_1578740 [Tanacetum coccineum]